MKTDTMMAAAIAVDDNLPVTFNPTLMPISMIRTVRATGLKNPLVIAFASMSGCFLKLVNDIINGKAIAEGYGTEFIADVL